MKILVLLIFLFSFYVSNSIESDEITQNEIRFIKWKVDTLNVLKKYYSDSTKFNYKSYSYRPNYSLKKRDKSYTFEYDKVSFSYSETDQLYLIFEYSYSKDILINRINDEKGTIGTILSLIDEYDELPKSNFHIEFKLIEPYYDSQTSTLNYELLTEIQDIRISGFDDKIEYIEYFYIRGRLNAKKVYKSEYFELK